DGIRDFHVTGVQTCALPICAEFSQTLELLPNFKASDDLRINSETSLSAPIAAGISMKASYTIRHDGLPEPGFEKTDRIFTTGVQIGRASCRERRTLSE